MKRYFFNKSLFSGGIWLIGEKFFLMGKGLILTYLFANLVARDVYGEYQYVVAFLGAIAVVAYPGMGIAIVQALARNKDGVFCKAIQSSVRASLLGVVLLFFLALFQLAIGQLSLAKIFIFLAIIFPGYAIMNYWRYYYTGKEQFYNLVRMGFFLEFISFIFSVVAIKFFPETMGLVLIGVIFPIPFFLALVFSLYKKNINLPSDNDNVAFGKKISIAVGISTLATYIDKLLLAHFLGFAELAIYTIAMIIPEQAKGVLNSFMVPLLPQYSKDFKKSDLVEHFVLFSFYSMASIVGIYLTLPFLFKIVFPQYPESLIYVKYLLVVIFFVPFVILETFFRSQKKDRIVINATLLGSLSGIIAALVLVPYWGIAGAISAKTIGLLFQNGSFLVAYFYFNRKAALVK